MTQRNQTVLTKRLYSIKELAAEVGATVWFWREAIWRGDIPVIIAGRRKQLVDIEDVNAFLERSKERNGVGV